MTVFELLTPLVVDKDVTLSGDDLSPLAPYQGEMTYRPVLFIHEQQQPPHDMINTTSICLIVCIVAIAEYLLNVWVKL